LHAVLVPIAQIHMAVAAVVALVTAMVVQVAIPGVVEAH
jgi:hypothetical protein